MIRGGSQNPPAQVPVQHDALFVQAWPVGTQLVLGAPQTVPVQTPPQQSPLAPQAEPFGAQGILQTCAVGSHTPRQQSVSTVQAAVSPRQVSVPKLQRGGSIVLSHTFVQHPLPGPESHVSPVGRQSRFA
jgi:hypothetical protein